MQIKRFFAKDMRAALTEVKETLGSDAVILSNKRVTGGIEIVAASEPHAAAAAPSSAARELDDDEVSLSARSSDRGVPPPAAKPTADKNRRLSSDELAEGLRELLAKQRQSVPAVKAKPSRKVQEPNWGSAEGPAPLDQQFAPNKTPARARPAPAHKADNDLGELKNEMATLRRLLEHQLSGLMWQEVERREPLRAMLIRRLTRVGFSEALADQLAGMIPEGYQPAEAWAQLADLLSGLIPVGQDELMRRGGAIALVGPTGVGKTTTIAKLAARFAARYGVESVALITTDSYRIGAHEQLATYGRILGCPVKLVKDEEELVQALHQLRQRRLVLIDTAGMGQRDVRLQEQLNALLASKNIPIRSYLVLSATSQRQVVAETLNQFKAVPLAGCILSKLDEAVRVGEVLSVIIEQALTLSYVTSGQRVPEDINVADAVALAQAAMQPMGSDDSREPFWMLDPQTPDTHGLYEQDDY